VSGTPQIRQAVVRHRDEVDPIPCPFGNVLRVVTGGEGGVANVHVVRVTEGGLHRHRAYDEVYYVLAGEGTLTVDARDHPLRPGSVAVIPAGCAHALKATGGQPLEFVIFGSPAMPIDDPRARPERP